MNAIQEILEVIEREGFFVIPEESDEAIDEAIDSLLEDGIVEFDHSCDDQIVLA